MKPVWIDCDPGTDDVLAILAALGSPALDVIGLTTVGGNADIDDATRNALATLEIAGRPEIPVWRGAGSPLKGQFQFAYEFHGESGIGFRMQPQKMRERPGSAVDAITQAVRARPGELTLIALGPLTNLALALRRYPGLADEVAEIVVMGGALEVAGNVTERAEFNIYNDAAAAAAVFGCGARTTLVGLDVTEQVMFRRGRDPWIAGEGASSALARRILRNWFDGHPDGTGYALHDPLAVAAAIDPDLLSCRRGRVAVEARAGTELGRTTATYGSGATAIALGVESERAAALIGDVIGAGS